MKGRSGGRRRSSPSSSRSPLKTNRLMSLLARTGSLSAPSVRRSVPGSPPSMRVRPSRVANHPARTCCPVRRPVLPARSLGSDHGTERVVDGERFAEHVQGGFSHMPTVSEHALVYACPLPLSSSDALYLHPVFMCACCGRSAGRRVHGRLFHRALQQRLLHRRRWSRFGRSSPPPVGRPCPPRLHDREERERALARHGSRRSAPRRAIHHGTRPVGPTCGEAMRATNVG